MKKVCIFGPIHLFGKDYLPVYKKLRELCKKYFRNVSCTYPDFWNSKETPRLFYRRSVKTVAESELMIGEVSMPSHGLGMELQVACERNIPFIALVKNQVQQHR